VANIFKARQIKTGEIVAIKLEKADSRKNYQRNHVERIIERLGDNNRVIKIFDFGTVNIQGNQQQYIVMEFFDGKNLKQFIDSGDIRNLTFDQLLGILINITEAVAHFHNKGLRHTDVAIHNFMVDENLNVKLVDYDIPYTLSFTYKDVYSLKRVLSQLLMQTSQKNVILDEQKALELWFESPTLEKMEFMSNFVSFIQKTFKNPIKYRRTPGIITKLKEFMTQYETQIDNSMMSRQKQTKGGIDFNPSNLELQIEGERRDLLPNQIPQDVEQMNIQGFYPVIFSITPVTNIPLILGVNREQENEQLSSLP